jgi:hypothetical protein
MKASSCPLATSSHHCRVVLFAALLCLLCGDLFAQTANSDYTADLPSVDRVETAIKGTGESDTMARQAAIFEYLMTYTQRIKETRSFSGSYTPGEIRVRTAYSLAAYQIEQAYKKTHTPAEVDAWSRLEFNYEINNALDWIHQLSGARANTEYHNTETSLAQTYKQHEQQLQQQMKQAWGGSNGQSPNGMSNDPTSLAVRRCLELGGDSLGCVGKGFGQGLLGMIGVDSKALGPHVAGVTMGGLYHSPASVTTVSFDGSSVAIENCGTLVADNHPYHIQKNGRTVEITIQNEPSPIHMFLRPDGSLTGPGLVDVKGRIITGYFIETKTHYGRDCPYGCSSSTRIPNYAAKMERCNIATPLNPPSPAQQSAASNVASQLESMPVVGALLGAAGTIAPASRPGIRMIGDYSGPGGLKLSFAGDAVILDCGQAHVKAPYTIENAPSNFLVHVQNSGGPFTLIVEPDNTLRGSGATTVNGRLVSGMNGSDVTYMPHSETCNVGTFRPAQSASTSATLASGPSVAPPRASPVQAASAVTSAAPSGLMLAIATSFPGARNPLAGRPVALMSARYDIALRKVGAPIPANFTPGKALQAYMANCGPPKSCPAYAAAMHPYFVGTTTFNKSGNSTITAPVWPGTYYVFCAAATPKGALVWDTPVTLKPGSNSITLTAANAEILSQ